MGRDTLMIDDNLIYGFQGPFRFLSNFWTVPHGIFFEGERYPTVEHAYQACKTEVPRERLEIRRAFTPGAAKALGRDVTLRWDWMEQRIFYMEGLLRQKFKRGSGLASQLQQTGSADLVEGNTWGDTFWGRCQGKGKNNLGLLLMEIRDDLNNPINEGK